MGMLNNLNQLLITKAFWSSCINFFVDFLGNYGWAIILFTICLKLVLSPFDIIQRRAMKKQTQMQQSLQPQLEKLKKQYGNDRVKLNEKTQELYQRNNANLKGTCLPMLISMIITMVVFFSLFNGLNAIAKSKDSEIFRNVQKTYSSEQTRVESTEYLDSLVGKTPDQIEEIQYNDIKEAVLKEYKNQKKKHGFLWVQNLWKSDTTTSPFVSYKDYKSYYKNKVENITDEDAFKDEFNTILKMVKSENRTNNGYFILIILAGVVTFLVQLISQKSMKKSNNNTSSPTNKVMLVVMPIMMLIFALNSNALFGLYIITNSIISAIISKIIDSCFKNKNDIPTDKIKTVKSRDVVEYSRNYFNGN